MDHRAVSKISDTKDNLMFRKKRGCSHLDTTDIGVDCTTYFFLFCLKSIKLKRTNRCLDTKIFDAIGGRENDRCQSLFTQVIIHRFRTIEHMFTSENL